MITDGIVKQEFIIEKVQAGFTKINQAQRDIYQKKLFHSGTKDTQYSRLGNNIQRRTGQMEEILDHPQIRIVTAGLDFMFTATIVKQMRFLDMKRNGNWRIYNAQVWGIFYRETFPAIKYDYGEHVTSRVEKGIREALTYKESNFGIEYNKAKGR